MAKPILGIKKKQTIGNMACRYLDVCLRSWYLESFDVMQWACWRKARATEALQKVSCRKSCRQYGKASLVCVRYIGWVLWSKYLSMLVVNLRRQLNSVCKIIFQRYSPHENFKKMWQCLLFNVTRQTSNTLCCYWKPYLIVMVGVFLISGSTVR